MNRMFFLSILFFNLIHCLSGLNLTYYPVEIQLTNASNVSSFESCLCKCLTSSNCLYFGFWFSLQSPTCQIYSSSEDKPPIISFVLASNDNQTGLYSIILSSNGECNLPNLNSTYNYAENSTTYFALQGTNIISVLVMSISNSTRLLAIDKNSFSYYVFDLNTYQIVDNNTFPPSGCIPLCAQQFSNFLYIGCSNSTIERRQFISNGTGKATPELINIYGISYPGGPPSCLAILNENIIYYVINSNHVHVFLTQTNTSKIIYSFSGIYFYSPYMVLALDSINMGLFLASSNGTLFRLELSSINIDNGTSTISNGSADQYQTPWNVRSSLFLDPCNQLWVLSSANPNPQLLLFIQQNNSNNSFSTMTITNYTGLLPNLTHSLYNFEFTNNYSLFTANAGNGLYALVRP